MFSQRSSFPRMPNRWSVLRDRALAEGRALLDLTESNPTRAGIGYSEERIRKALADPGVTRYAPNARGLLAAREAIARRYEAAGTPVEPARIVLTASSSESYAFLFKLLADPGDAVMVPAPGYPLFDFLGRLEAVEPVPYPLNADDGWALDPDALASAAPTGARAVVLVNPGNPTGRFLTAEERGRLTPVCRDRGWAIVSDEVFADYAWSDDPRRVTCAAHGAEALTFSLGGLSKSAGLPQVKLGWIAIGGPEVEVRDALERLDTIADSFLSVSASAQYGLEELLQAGDRVRAGIRVRIAENREQVGLRTRSTACRLLGAEGGWYGILQVPATRSGEEWALRLMEREDVLVHPGYFYDFPREAYLVLSLLPEPELLSEGVDRLVRRIEEEA